MSQITKNFSIAEMQCPCCLKCDMDKPFMELLQLARDKAGIPFPVNSGFRCVKHNLKVGGEVNSSHLIGHAVDIRAIYSKTRLIMTRALLDAGFKCIKLYSRWIHADTDSSKPDGLFL